ncbi:hypothetical protein R1flu_018643 [Riccia fluitans]|uniref:Uncharacterized protein n=1 Tax=Riccia fluitans TaxID=41844 RepID=A0ABD1ZGS5_9MARC
MESGVLALKNAQSHTMRKIIVFASLGLRHGCDDLYELSFDHFSVEQRGEPFISSKQPGEHVLYNHPGVRKIFYPNRQNPILCPVKILDEEKAMRPAGPCCPSCLFLGIKYGGRTRDLPQNQYVRQRMGRNKLKSFGPLMCQMALLVHIRTGSFFFKALGIALFFMAGFPDDLVRKETKYRNLDLLQKYYRSDEDAKQEVFFHPYPPFFPQAAIAGSSGMQRGNTVNSSSCSHPTPPFAMYPGYCPAQRPPGGFAPLPVWSPVNAYPPPPLGGYPPLPPYTHLPYHHFPHFESHPFYGPYFAFPHYGENSLNNNKKEVKIECKETESDSDVDSSSSTSETGQRVEPGKGKNHSPVSKDGK